jgi:hypothetical protein
VIVKKKKKLNPGQRRINKVRQFNNLLRQFNALLNNFTDFFASEGVAPVAAQEVKVLTSDTFDYLLNDPTTPDIKRNIAPPQATNDLAIDVIGFTRTPSNDSEIMAAQVYTAVTHAKNTAQTIIAKYRGKLTKWAATKTLKIHPAAGVDFNAYYDRKGLRFFYATDTVDSNQVYSAQSVDVVAHETGHAILDALRPDLWNSVAPEVWAFHESFADMMAILTSMQYDELLQNALDETGGDLSKSNVITRSAEELGKAIYDMYDGEHNGILDTALRDASIDYNYVRPVNLPKSGKDDQLLNQPHSFSRVFTSTFWDLLNKIYIKNKNNGQTNLQAMKTARDVVGYYIFKAVALAPNNVRFYAGVANAMLVADKAKGSPYRAEIAAVFNDKKILVRKIKMLSANAMTKDRMMLGVNDEYYRHNLGSAARLSKPLTIKLKNHMRKDQVVAMNNGIDLSDVEIEVPNDQYYEFDPDGNAENEFVNDKDEVVADAVNALQVISSKDQIGEDKMWAVRDGKLVRNRIICKCRR